MEVLPSPEKRRRIQPSFFIFSLRKSPFSHISLSILSSKLPKGQEDKSTFLVRKDNTFSTITFLFFLDNHSWQYYTKISKAHYVKGRKIFSSLVDRISVNPLQTSKTSRNSSVLRNQSMLFTDFFSAYHKL